MATEPIFALLVRFSLGDVIGANKQMNGHGGDGLALRIQYMARNLKSLG